jgi:FkbM family methyltransferase
LKATIKRILASLGWSLHRSPPGVVMGFDLNRDLAITIGSQSAPVCIDAGAHVGQFIDLLRSSFADPRIHAFEPAPEPFARLTARYGGMPNVSLINAGLGISGGEISFNIFDNQTLNSFLPMLSSGKGTLGEPKLVRSISVPVYCLDEYSISAGLVRIDLLKIDTQGYELNILKGARQLLAQGKVRAVLLELNFVPLYDRQVWAHEIFGFLHEHGFGLVDLYEKCRLNPRLGWCTALFTLRETTST